MEAQGKGLPYILVFMLEHLVEERKCSALGEADLVKNTVFPERFFFFSFFLKKET